MEPIDLTRRTQRARLLALTSIYPAIWLIGLAKTLTYGVPADSIALAASPGFLLSAAGAFGAIRRARVGRPASRIQRYALYTTWGWLVPFCLIAAMAVSAFGSLWPVLVVLALPAPIFLFSRFGRERFLVCAAGCVVLAWLLMLASSDATLGFNTRLLIPLLLTAAPFWSLAAYAALTEHVIHGRINEPSGRHEIKVAFLVSLIGILIFFGICFGLLLVAVSSLR